jgi:YidC/Oxa1 family membrane protein insertase
MMAVIYISIPAAVVVYFIVSSLFRIGQQEWMYRRDPHIVGSMKELSQRKVVTEAKPKPLAGQRSTGTKGAKPGTAVPGSTKSGTAKSGTAKPGASKATSPRPSGTTPKSASGRPNGTGTRPSRNGAAASENGSTDATDEPPKRTPRAQGKRERKPR